MAGAEKGTKKERGKNAKQKYLLTTDAYEKHM
jgi:hypothetical protein